jgi:uncharacterized membrane protein
METFFSMDGLLFLFRWLHFFFGIIWIGLLYYLNFIHGSFMAEADASLKPVIATKLLPKVLWWFRWGAMWTFVTGWLYLAVRGHMIGLEAFASGWGIFVLTGAILGSLMWFNVWFVIWPAQQVVITSAEGVLAGKPALADAPGAAARALTASRTNVVFSVPMLLCMGSASHVALSVNPDTSKIPLVGLLTVIFGALEWNAVAGKVGPLATVRNAIHIAFVLGISVSLAIHLLA